MSHFRKAVKTLEFGKITDMLADCAATAGAKKLAKELPLGARVTLFDADGFFALGEVKSFDGGLAIKPIRQF